MCDIYSHFLDERKGSPAISTLNIYSPSSPLFSLHISSRITYYNKITPQTGTVYRNVKSFEVKKKWHVHHAIKKKWKKKWKKHVFKKGKKSRKKRGSQNVILWFFKPACDRHNLSSHQKMNDIPDQWEISQDIAKIKAMLKKTFICITLKLAYWL